MNHSRRDFHLLQPRSYPSWIAFGLVAVVSLAFAQICRADDACASWFKKSKLKPGKDCLLDCVSLPVDMGTFTCHEECTFLCQSSGTEDFLFKVSDLYPGLTAEERALAAKEPVKSATAYRLALTAEKLCNRVYPSSRTNDESDACRHFVWASLLYREFGTEFSNQVLNAHEQDPKQPTAEKSMDLANNRQGLLSAEELQRAKKLNDEAILDSFQTNLSKGRLIVLKKRATSGGKK